MFDRGFNLMRVAQDAECSRERARKAAIAADRGESAATVPPCPMPDNKDGFRRYVNECWTDRHRPVPAGWAEFVAYLDATRAESSARFAMRCYDLRRRKEAIP